MSYAAFQKAFKESCESVGAPCLLPENFSIGGSYSIYAMVAAAVAGIVDIVKNLPRDASLTDLLAAAVTRGNEKVTALLYKIPGVSEWANGRMWTRGMRLPPGFGGAKFLAKTAGDAYAAWIVGAWVGATIYATGVVTGANNAILGPMTNAANNYYEAGGFMNMMAGVQDANRAYTEASAREAAVRKMKMLKTHAQQANIQIPPVIAAKLRGI